MQNLAVKLKAKWTITCSMEHLVYFVYIVFFFSSEFSKLVLSSDFIFHLECLQLYRRCSIFFILLTSCKCDSRLLIFPWKKWCNMLFNSFSDMTLMVCVETVVIKPRNISRNLSSKQMRFFRHEKDITITNIYVDISDWSIQTSYNIKPWRNK